MLSLQLFKSMGYGFVRGPFLVWLTFGLGMPRTDSIRGIVGASQAAGSCKISSGVAPIIYDVATSRVGKGI